ncbi:hypothetical protein GCM10027271_55410 [Saccharopolyspora gloriosae]|uniref:Phosphatidylethanolamine-binding protein (PEBP) family uncharacterized protein n=1 Tax=Saccharopolyspora gloriosae TaxID=455344 RepID=A0A840NFA0_9PSEU|nr:hypothetical protein [Saccharopolyspora gloriosae]MBB5068918.1 phosphatidylethanolamine-binding protein (PEBP) family uncharacterized protein [Saccharopolyspora gloriosae]
MSSGPEYADDRADHDAGIGSPWVHLFSGDLAADLAAAAPPDGAPDLVTLGVVLTRLREL